MKSDLLKQQLAAMATRDTDVMVTGVWCRELAAYVVELEEKAAGTWTPPPPPRPHRHWGEIVDEIEHIGSSVALTATKIRLEGERLSKLVDELRAAVGEPDHE